MSWQARMRTLPQNYFAPHGNAPCPARTRRGGRVPTECQPVRSPPCTMYGSTSSIARSRSGTIGEGHGQAAMAGRPEDLEILDEAQTPVQLNGERSTAGRCRRSTGVGRMGPTDSTMIVPFVLPCVVVPWSSIDTVPLWPTKLQVQWWKSSKGTIGPIGRWTRGAALWS